MKVRIQDYQTIKDTELEVKGFTVIVGKSNTGKTAILRAMEGSLFNDPVGGRVREGETDTVVTIEHGDLSWTWKKGENFNDYIVSTPAGTEHYSSVGRKAPDEIKAAGFREWRVDGEKARPQVAEWHQPIFLLNKPGKAVTELMTAVTRLDVVNLAIRNGSTEIRKNRQTIKLREADLQKYEQRAREYEQLKDLPSAEIGVLWKEHQNLAEQIKVVDTYTTSYENLTRAIEGLDSLDTVSVPARMDMEISRDIATLTQWLVKLNEIQELLEALDILNQVCIPDRVELPKDIELLTTLVSRLAKADSSLDALKSLNDVVVPAKDDGSLVKQVSALLGYMASIVKVGTELKSVKTDIEKLTIILDEETHKLHELRGQIDECSVCGNKEVSNAI